MSVRHKSVQTRNKTPQEEEHGAPTEKEKKKEECQTPDTETEMPLFRGSDRNIQVYSSYINISVKLDLEQ